MAVRPPQDIIAKNLSSPRGYPLWTPEQSVEQFACRPEGLRIGDVGVVLPDHGSFDCFFNLCAPPNDACHRSKGVPEGFTRVELSEGDITTIPDAEPRGGSIKSSAVKSVRMSEQQVAADRPSITNYEFEFSPQEGAILILPDGAERHEVKDPRPFFEQAAKHAATWYHFAEQKLGRIISRESMYVVTGFTKARTWSIAGFQEGEGEQGDSTGYFRFSPQKRGGYGSTHSWNMSGPRTVHSRVGDSSEIPNQTVFVHGFKIGLRSAVRGLPQRWSHFEPAAQPHPEAGSWLANAWKGLSRRIGVSDENCHERTGAHIEIARIPEILPVFHPGEAINQYLFYKVPSAKVAITHDSDWGSLLEEGLIQLEHLVEDEHLAAAVSKHFSVLSQDGVAYLERKPESKRSSAPLNVLSSSNYRCTDDRPTTTSEIRPEDLLSLPSSFRDAPGVPSVSLLSQEPRVVKIMVISDYLCAFCYLIDKVIYEAIEECRNLPVVFDVEFRPFTLLSPSAADSQKGTSRNAYIIKKFGKEQAEAKLKAVAEVAEKTGLKLSPDGIICRTNQAQRLSVKAYEAGGQSMQREFNNIIFNACLTMGEDISDEDLLANAAAEAGLMPKEQAVKYLQSNEDVERVEKMIEAAKLQGVNGVPFIIIDGKWAVNGVQPMECFVQIFRKLAQNPKKSKE